MELDGPALEDEPTAYGSGRTRVPTKLRTLIDLLQTFTGARPSGPVSLGYGWLPALGR
jgi:hypothetical protein